MKKITSFIDCQELLADKAADVFAVGKSSYHGLGIALLMPESHIVCFADENLAEVVAAAGIKVKASAPADRKVSVKSSAKLLAQKEVVEYLSKNPGRPQLYLSKNYPRIQKLAEKYGWDILAPTAKLNREFEDKTAFASFANKLFGDKVSRQVVEISENRLAAVADKYSWPLVVQFNRGLAGEGTFLLENETAVADFAKKYSGRDAVVAPKFVGSTITLNACVTGQGVVVGAPFLQISGVAELNSTWSGTCGNDYGTELPLDEPQRQQIFADTLRVGEAMRAQGYRGLFGLDFVVGTDVRLIEINARPPASVPTFTQLEHEQGTVSLLGLHLLEFLGIAYEINIPEINQQKFAIPLRGSKLVFRNTSESVNSMQGDFKAGVYRISDSGEMAYLRPGFSLSSISKANEALLWSVKNGSLISPNAEIATVVLPFSVTNPEGKLDEKSSRIVAKLKDRF